MKILSDLLTTADGITHDIGRHLAFFGGLNGIALTIVDVVVNHNKFDMQSYGIGFGALAVGVGAMLKLKVDTEPK
jgi:hypothetical protein